MTGLYSVDGLTVGVSLVRLVHTYRPSTDALSLVQAIVRDFLAHLQLFFPYHCLQGLVLEVFQHVFKVIVDGALGGAISLTTC
jgi:hypothetical protein